MRQRARAVSRWPRPSFSIRGRTTVVTAATEPPQQQAPSARRSSRTSRGGAWSVAYRDPLQAQWRLPQRRELLPQRCRDQPVVSTRSTTTERPDSTTAGAGRRHRAGWFQEKDPVRTRAYLPGQKVAAAWTGCANRHSVQSRTRAVSPSSIRTSKGNRSDSRQRRWLPCQLRG